MLEYGNSLPHCCSTRIQLLKRCIDVERQLSSQSGNFNMTRQFLFIASIVLANLVLPASAQDHHHEHGEEKRPVQPPKVFLDKSPRIVAYQLNRLDNERLLMVERKTDDPKYAPVYTAILTRAGMSPQHCEHALSGLVELHKTDEITELLAALESLDADDRQQRRTSRQLATMLLRQSPQSLKKKAELLGAATKSENNLLRPVGFAGLVVAGLAESAWSTAKNDEAKILDWLACVPLVPKPGVRSRLRDTVVELIGDAYPKPVQRAAIEALAFVPAEQNKNFQLIAPFVSNKDFRTTAIRTLLRIPKEQRDPQTCEPLAVTLVRHAEATPAAQRTTDEFIDAMQLADQLLARIPESSSRSFRARLREITVRVVRIRTVEEEMRYDIPYFAVEAGRPVQIVLQNEDLMPHNLVITVNGALKEVALEGAVLGPNPGFEGKPYVPKSEKVLHATGMVPAGRQERLTFNAPSEPGEYPFVCTFPRHWMRMYGVMVVVEDLDAWQKDPIEPKDPIGSNRSFVHSWIVDDLLAELESGMRGRSPEIGQRIFTEATCAQCHKVNGQGGAVGPELNEVLKRWKGDRVAVLREILDPSHRIDPKYAVQLIETVDGRIITGIVKTEDKTSVSIVDNPEAPKPTVIQRSDIEEMVKTSKSMMPKALLDRFTKDEIFELLAYLVSEQKPSE